MKAIVDGGPGGKTWTDVADPGIRIPDGVIAKAVITA